MRLCTKLRLQERTGLLSLKAGNRASYSTSQCCADYLLPHIFATAWSLPNKPMIIQIKPPMKKMRIGRKPANCDATMAATREIIDRTKNRLPINKRIFLWEALYT